MLEDDSKKVSEALNLLAKAHELDFYVFIALRQLPGGGAKMKFQCIAAGNRQDHMVDAQAIQQLVEQNLQEVLTLMFPDENSSGPLLN